MKKITWYHSRTMWISIGTSLVGVLYAVAEAQSQSDISSGTIIAFAGVLTGMLRFLQMNNGEL